jgi:hypothetical protein
MEVDPSKDRRVLFYGETMKKAMLFVISAYQLVRFLSLALLLGFTGMEAGGSWSLVLALAAAGLITPLIFFRLALVTGEESAQPIRELAVTVKLLETTAAAILAAGTLQGLATAFTPEAMLLPAIASLIVVVDVIVLFIVLLLHR